MNQHQERFTKPEQMSRPKAFDERGLARSSQDSSMSPGNSTWSPLAWMRKLMDQMTLSMPSAGDAWFTRPWPAIEIFERGGQLVVRADVPGMRAEDLRVRVDDGLLRIEGTRRNELERQEAGVYRSERSYGMFQRNVPLPGGIEEDKVQARFESGVLEVTMPSPAQSAKGRMVPIRSGGDNAMKS